MNQRREGSASAYSAGESLILGGLYAITDQKLSKTGQLIEWVEAAILGGAKLIQYRDKGSDPGRRTGEARVLLALCQAHGVPLIINDDMFLAKAIGADGVHLGREDPSPSEARAFLGGGALIGVSCYNSLARAVVAEQAGADYVAFGSFFPSVTKPQAVQANLELLGRARGRLQVAVCAIGGITPENGASLVAAGADLLAVIHGVFGQGDPEAAARRYARLFEEEVL
jgi:thiamine-phosphate pyrophosphorylase